MLVLPCPWCGDRPEGEFVCAGEALPVRPADPSAMTDQEWVDQLCLRQNRRGPHLERWWHYRGCGTWFTIRRDTATHELGPAAPGEP